MRKWQNSAASSRVDASFGGLGKLFSSWFFSNFQIAFFLRKRCSSVCDYEVVVDKGCCELWVASCFFWGHSFSSLPTSISLLVLRITRNIRSTMSTNYSAAVSLYTGVRSCVNASRSSFAFLLPFQPSTNNWHNARICFAVLSRMSVRCGVTWLDVMQREGLNLGPVDGLCLDCTWGLFCISEIWALI